MLLNLCNSRTTNFRILTSYWLAGGISAILELLILESSLPIGWQGGEAYFTDCYDFFKSCLLLYSKGLKVHKSEIFLASILKSFSGGHQKIPCQHRRFPVSESFGKKIQEFCKFFLYFFYSAGL